MSKESEHACQFENTGSLMPSDWDWFNFRLQTRGGCLYSGLLRDFRTVHSAMAGAGQPSRSANAAASARGPATSTTPASVPCVCLCTPVLWAKGAANRPRQPPRPSYFPRFLATAFALSLAFAGTAANFATGRFCPAIGARTARTAAPRTTAASGAVIEFEPREF